MLPDSGAFGMLKSTSEIFVNPVKSCDEPIYFTYFRFQTRDADTLELAEPERAEITMVSPSLNGRVMVSVVVATS